MKKSLGFKNLSYRQQGIALVTVLILLVIITTLVTVSTLLALGNRNSSADTIQGARAQNLAEAGIEKALDSVFFETYRRWVIGGEGAVTGAKFDLCAFKKWLTGYWGGSSITVQKDITKLTLTTNNNSACIYTGAPDAAKPKIGSTGLDAPAVPGLLNDGSKVTLPDITKALLGGLSADGSDYSVTVTVKRVDNGDDINLIFESTSIIKNGTQELSAKKIARTLNLSGSPFPGDEFALLTNDINCSICHLHVDNMKRVYADPTTSTEIFKRVKLGAIDPLKGINFNPQGHTDDSLFAGTLYSRGTTAPTVGKTVYFSPWASVGAGAGYVHAGTNDTVGALYSDATVPGATYDPAANPNDVKPMNGSLAGVKPKGKIYYNYPVGNGPDGIVPDKFPTIIPDSNSDGLISDAEWTSYIAGAPRGSLVIGGGAVVYGVRRPSSVDVGADIPISYDPISVNSFDSTAAAIFSGSRLGDKFIATNLWNWSGTKVVGGNMDIVALTADILKLNTLTSTWVASSSAANKTLMIDGEKAFVKQWRGWLLQQAIASPNNRDLLPTNDSVSGVFTALKAPNANGIVQQNFWTAYDPVNGIFSMAYCRKTPCKILAAGNDTDPENGVRNVSILSTALLSTRLAVLAIPLAPTELYPAASNSAAFDVQSGTNSKVNGLFDGNLIVDAGRIGDVAQRFITIAGTIHVNGDLVIRGQVKGEGRFIVRGNVYVVGDMVYGCTSSACKIVDGTDPSYRNPDGLPKLAVLAGGSIIVGDYDHPDFRANRSQLNLINDQLGQQRQPTAGATAAENTSWQLQMVPGATGTNMTENEGGNMGFAPMIAAFGNDHTQVRFASAPFGFMVKRTGFGPYESEAPINATELGTYAIQTLYPSNGSIRIGDVTNKGFNTKPIAAGVISNVNLSCISAVNQLPSIPTVFDTTLQTLNSGFWCPPTNKVIRNWDLTGTSPIDATTTTWMSQPTANKALDGNVGMTTGWLGGLLRVNQTSAGFDQLGDLSQTKLLKIFWLATMESNADRDPNTTGDQFQGPLRTDGLFYSRNSLFCVARYYQDIKGGTQSNTQGRWIHNGSVLSFELGFLLTGDVTNSASQFTTNRTTPVDFTPATNPDTNKGPAMGVYFDERLSGILGITGGALEIRRTGVFSQVGR